MINNYPYGVNDGTGKLSGATGIIIYDANGRVKFQSTGGGGSAAWGSIGAGTGVGSQTDLVTYLNGNYYPLASNPAGYITNVTATLPITSSGGATPNISTSISTNKLVGRTTAGSGVMEEISVGLGLQLSGGELKDTDFDFSLNFQVVQPYTIILSYDFRIDTVYDPTPITYTITVNALPYVLGTLINAEDIVVVTPGAIGWINLNCTKLS